MRRTDFYCVIQANGAFCLWSLGRSRTDSWRAFLRGTGYSSTDMSENRKRVQKEGCRCVRVRIEEIKEK